MLSNLPPGYNGTDRPSQLVELHCANGHEWTTRVFYEFGITVFAKEECPTCNALPEEDYWEEIDQDDYWEGDR